MKSIFAPSRVLPLLRPAGHVRHHPPTRLIRPWSAVIHTSCQRRDPGPSRYGTAKERPPHLRDAEEDAEEEEEETERPTPILETEHAELPEAEADPEVANTVGTEQPIILPSPEEVARAELHTIPDGPEPAPSSQPSLDRVLDLTSPTQREEDKPPHLQAPRYVHHFDTWTLVRDLQAGGLSSVQSTTVMKAVRGLLADNIELARRALVSKSNVENETYLFRAACSELKTEIQNNRQAEADRWRNQRAQLQHEVDILTQKMTQDLTALKDELKGSFDDRKMTVRVEQKSIESKIQELNYKITRSLGSDARGLVESVRWSFIRQVSAAALGILVTVVCVFAYMKRVEREEEARKKAQAREVVIEHDVEKKITRGAPQGLSEEALLAGDGVSGG